MNIRLEVGFSPRVSQLELDSGLVSEMGHMDTAYPLSMREELKGNPEEVATTTKTNLQELLFPYLEL